jgi:plasmid replication initiation protein
MVVFHTVKQHPDEQGTAFQMSGRQQKVRFEGSVRVFHIGRWIRCGYTEFMEVGKPTKISTELVVRRRNEMVMGKYCLSYQAQRLFMYVLSKVRDDHTSETSFSFSVYELAQKIKVDRAHLYTALVGALDELEGKRLFLDEIDEDGNVIKGRVTRVGLIVNKQSFKVGPNARLSLGGEISISLHKELLPYVQRLAGRYTEIDLNEFFRLKTTFGQRLYELLKSQSYKHEAWRVSREELRALLGIDDGKFELWGDFRRFVLERAQADIGTHAPSMEFVIEYVKTGQVVTEIIFRLLSKIGAIKVLRGTEQHEALKSMLDLGLSQVAAGDLLQVWWETDKDRLLWHIEAAKRGLEKGKIKNTRGWLQKAVAKDYRPSKIEARKLSLTEWKRQAAEKRENYQKEGGSVLKRQGDENVKSLFLKREPHGRI